MKVHAHLRFTVTIDDVVSVAEGAVKVDAFAGAAKGELEKVQAVIAALGEEVLQKAPKIISAGAFKGSDG